MAQRLIQIFLLSIFGMCIASCRTSTSGDADTGIELMHYSDALSLRENEDGSLTAVIRNPVDTTSVIARYVLVPKDMDLKETPGDGSVIIRTPVESLLVYSSVYTSVLEELGAIDVVGGVADSRFFTSPGITDRIKSNTIVDVGSADSPSVEKIMELHPDAILISIYKGMDVKGIDRTGIPILKFADNLETSPLGRAEWIRFIGRLAGCGSKADSIFNSVERRYVNLKKEVESTADRPKVLLDNMYQGIWYVSGGKSYQSRLVQDAGAVYPWSSDNSTGSLNLSLEEVFDKAHDADIWLLKLFGVPTLDKSGLLRMDTRYEGFKAVDNGGVWYSDTSVSGIFDETPFHPDRLLEEYIAIFHPGLIPDIAPRYYRQMTE